MSESHARVDRPILAACVMRANRLKIDDHGRPCCCGCGKVLQNAHAVFVSDFEIDLVCPRCRGCFGSLRGSGLLTREDVASALPDGAASERAADGVRSLPASA